MDSDSEPESKLISLISQLMVSDSDWDWDEESQLISFIIQIISLVNLTDLDSQPKPESELTSLISQTVSVFNSMDLDSQRKPLSEVISVIKRTFSLFKSLDLYSEPMPLSKLKSLITEEHSLLNSVDSDWEFRSPVDQKLSLRPKPNSDLHFFSLFVETMSLETEPELMSLIHQICFLVISMNSKWNKLISLSPQVEVSFGAGGKFRVTRIVKRGSNNKWECLPAYWEKFRLTGEDDTHFLCNGCKGQNHENFEKAPIVIKHPLHPKHSLQLVLLEDEDEDNTRKCYCCDEDLIELFYYCSTCDFAMNITCVEKPPVLSKDHPKWHEHTLSLFPRHASLTCNVCALADLSSPIYMCPPCDFVVHLRCINLPRVIRISRHLHRISFTPSFDQGDWSCGVCRRKIDNDYGGYSCIKEGCSYAAHSRCATQRNVWDGRDLEGEPEEIEEELLEPFVRIGDGIIQHFSHQQHHLILDEDTSRDYDENKLCQACITPIYFGNFYSCMQCDYILHETCANLSRKIHHPIHPHLLTLVGGYDGVLEYHKGNCSACPLMCKPGFFYECGKEGCYFKVHVQCATISEPLDHESHRHPLFLTSKPGERRTCGVCNGSSRSLEYSCNSFTDETFNCIEECDFGLCFACATLPEKVRYKHDKHMLSLSYGEETSTMTYWCEACEKKINPQKRFYKCDEYCCVNLHIECLIGKDLYMKLGSSWWHWGTEARVLPNNQHMSRPICSKCKMRCPYKIVFQLSGMIACSVDCTLFLL